MGSSVVVDLRSWRSADGATTTRGTGRPVGSDGRRPGEGVTESLVRQERLMDVSSLALVATRRVSVRVAPPPGGRSSVTASNREMSHGALDTVSCT